jgi:glycerol-3-phosphate dehydrogenase
MYDVVIIGAGVVGCGAARELSKYSLRTLVLEKGFDVCAGASKANSGMVHAGFDPVPGSNEAKFNVRGCEMLGDLCAELDVAFNRCGTMVFATTEENLRELERLKVNGEANGVPVEIITPPALYEMQPDIGRDVLAVLWAPTGGMVSPYGLVFALAESAAQNGVEFRLETEVTGIERIDDGWRLDTNNGTYEARVVLNCAGTHADEMNNMVSEHTFHIIPRFGGNLLLDRKYADKVSTVLIETPFDLPGGGHTKGMGIMPSVDGTIVLGCDVQYLGDKDNVSCNRDCIRMITEFFQRTWKNLPAGSDGKPFPLDAVIAYYGGVRAHPDTDDFIIGEVPDAPGFINAAGTKSPGLTAGPAIAQYIAELCVQRLGAAPNPDYQPGRRHKKKFRTMTREEREQAVREDPDYAKIVCRCELVTEAEIRDAIRRPLGARSVAGVKLRTRAGMGRCQGGFCSPRVVEILCEELGWNPLDVTMCGGHSPVLAGRACGCGAEMEVRG